MFSRFLYLVLPPLSVAINNGLASTPALGWSSWYASPDGSQVTSAFVRNITRALINSGLAAKGYVYVNIDEGWLKGRFPNGTIYEDREKFPEGMAALGQWVTSQETSPGSGQYMKYGLYSCRGTCQCSTDKYSGPGGQGYEKQDVEWMAACGISWLKVDSCCGSQDHATAFADYARWRDALNATGKPIWFNLCGWNSWYSTPDPSLNYTGGGSLGNSWRIDGDGSTYAAMTSSINTMAAVGVYAGPGGWNDADNINGPHGTVSVITEEQARVQMILWSMFPTQLILGEDVTQASQTYIDTVGNEELIAINQDSPYMGPARRIVGGDLTWPCTGGELPLGAFYAVQAQPCSPFNDPVQSWLIDSTDGSIRLAGLPPSVTGLLTVQDCGSEDGTLVYVYPPGGDGNSTCGSQNAVWTYNSSSGQIINPVSGKCLDEYMWTTPRVDVWTCEDGATNEQWKYTGGQSGPGVLKNEDSGLCLTAVGVQPGACTNIWARPLSDGSTAIGIVNNGDASVQVTCDAACFASANITHTGGMKLRDIIAHTDLGVLQPPYSFAATVSGGGSGAAFTLTPV